MRRTLTAVVVCASTLLLPVALGQSVVLARPAPDDLGGSTIDAVLQQAYVKASNTGANDHFGASVSASASTLVVGAWGEASAAKGVNGNQSNNNAPYAGAAYVFVRNSNAWSQQAYLKASNTEIGSAFDNDEFGWSVSVSGDTVVIGAPNEDSNATGVNGDQTNNAAPHAGAAYVFVRNGETWSQQAYLKASNAESSDHFGWSVSVSGDTVVVGAYDEYSNATGVNGEESNNSATEAGAAYVFVRNGTTWSQQAYLKASNTGPGDFFGWSVSVSGDTAVVGALHESSDATGVNGDQTNNSAVGAGAAYVFVRSGTTWTQQAYLKASNSGFMDEFGRSVSVSGDTVAIGAHQEDSDGTGVNGNQHNESAQDSGAAYVFVRNGTTWSQQAYLKASNTGASDEFGYSVSVSGNAAVVGAWLEWSSATGVNGDESDNSAIFAGAAYVFVRSGMSWSQQAYLKASYIGRGDPWGDKFGQAVSVSGDTVVAGADEEDSNATGVNGDQTDDSAARSGAAYVFDLGIDAWTDLGSGLAGLSGVPQLAGTGPLSPSSGNQLQVSSANPSSPATLVVGLSQLDAPFKGGTLVPAPLLLVPLATNPSGALSLPFTWPSSVPPGMALYFQFWISDPGSVAGFAASNGLEGLSS